MKKIDMHCHILPGIDDGSANPKETLAMLRMALNQDFVGMIVTPHGSARNASVERVQEIFSAVRQMQMAGYVPILAHVERYHVLREEGRLEELADTGARIQMNYSSIDGGWNNNTAQWCKRQLKDGLVHYLGTDMHNSGERSPQTEHVEKWLNKNLSEDYVWALIQGNARRILDDRGSHKPKT